MTINIPAIEQAQQNGITIGVVPDGGKTALRLEIDDLLKDTELANLYLLALDAAQKDSTPWSYYEISGIHGYPQRPWNEVNNGFNGFGGYCVHGRPNFPTWHRVYLAQYEVRVPVRPWASPRCMVADVAISKPFSFRPRSLRRHLELKLFSNGSESRTLIPLGRASMTPTTALKQSTTAYQSFLLYPGFELRQRLADNMRRLPILCIPSP